MGDMVTFASLCTGGGGVEIGARAAGLTPLWGLELEAEIAAVARANRIAVTVGNVTTTNPRDFEPADVLHASPPCPNFSQANTNGRETVEDVSIARGVARFIEAHEPRVFTLENVGRYAYSESWRTIQEVLDRLGYFYDVHGGEYSARLCAADAGVPQTRRRFWVRAVRGALLPPLPRPVAWRGWYAAVEDLLPGCPESPLAPWQEERLKDHPVVGPLLVGAGGFSGDAVTRESSEPAMTVTANRNQCNQVRAVLVASGNHSHVPTVRQSEEPAFTVVAQSERAPARAIIECRTVKMTLACTARFQGFPDDYAWSDDAQLNATINGNAVPPPWYAWLVGPLVRGW